MAERRPDGDEAALARYADDLADAVESAIAGWVRSCVVSRHPEPLASQVEAEVEEAGQAAARDVVPRLRELLALDIDEQWTNPLAIIRAATAYPTAVLESIGVDPVDRDETARRLHPDDPYDLVPASFADLGPSVHEPGLLWGAAKAHIHLKRRKRKEMA